MTERSEISPNRELWGAMPAPGGKGAGPCADSGILPGSPRSPLDYSEIARRGSSLTGQRFSTLYRYVVATLEHAGDSWHDDRFSGTSANWQRRPGQLNAVLDRLLVDPELGRRIDSGHIGHSAGGYTVLALIGAKANMRILARHCTVHLEDDPGFCGYGHPEGRIGGSLPDLSDPRIRAVPAVAPVVSGMSFAVVTESSHEPNFWPIETLPRQFRTLRAAANSLVSPPFLAARVALIVSK